MNIKTELKIKLSASDLSTQEVDDLINTIYIYIQSEKHKILNKLEDDLSYLEIRLNMMRDDLERIIINIDRPKFVKDTISELDSKLRDESGQINQILRKMNSI